MGTSTPNYNLYLPDYTESADVGQINANMTKLDTNLKTVSNSAATNTSGLATANNNIATNTADIATLKLNDMGIAVKAADQTRASVTLVDVADLQFSVVTADISKKFVFEIHLFVDGQVFGPDIKIGFVFPGAGAGLSFSGQGAHNGDLVSGSGSSGTGEWLSRINNASPSATIPYGASTSITGLVIKGIYFPTAAGAFKLQYAQNNANATGLIIKANSYMEWKKYS